MGPRRRRVVWSDGAFRELDEATEYVAQDSRQAAVRLLQQLLDAAQSLSEFAERGRVVPELDDPSIRELQVNPYRLVYSVSDTEVAILGVLHQRRDFDRWGRSDLA